MLFVATEFPNLETYAKGSAKLQADEERCRASAGRRPDDGFSSR